MSQKNLFNSLPNYINGNVSTYNFIKRIDRNLLANRKLVAEGTTPPMKSIFCAALLNHASQHKDPTTLKLYRHDLNASFTSYDHYLNRFLKVAQAPNTRLEILLDHTPQEESSTTASLTAWKITQLLLKDDRYNDKIKVRLINNNKKENIQNLMQDEFNLLSHGFIINHNQDTYCLFDKIFHEDNKLSTIYTDDAPQHPLLAHI